MTIVIFVKLVKTHPPVMMSTNELAEKNVIKASEFKAKCLKLMDAISESGEELVITKNGTPVAKLVPFVNPQSLFGLFKDDIEILGDIMEPIDAEWEVLNNTDEDRDR